MAELQDDEDEVFSFENEVVFVEDADEVTLETERIDKNTEDAANEIVAEQNSSKESASESKLDKKSVNVTEPLPSREKEGFIYGTGKLIRLSKPLKDDGIVDRLFFEFTSSPFAPWTFVVKSSSIFVFGFNLARANLAMHLKYGDECTIKFKSRSKRISSITLWIGPADVKPVRPSVNKEFQHWLEGKKITVTEFSNWVKNKVNFKPYFPWEEDIYAANIVDMVWDNLGVAVGAFLKVKSVYRAASERQITKKSEASFAILARDDFYVCGIPVGLCDLQNLLKKNQSVLIQIHRLTSANIQNLELILSQQPDLKVKYQAYIGWVGNERPTGPRRSTRGNRDLKTYLSRNNLSLTEFEHMRDYGSESQDPQPNNSVSKSDNRQPLLPLPPEKHCVQAPVDMDIVEEHQLIENDNRPSHSRATLHERDLGGTPVAMATRLMKSLFDLDSVEDPRIRHLLQSQEEVDLALKITTFLSRAMSARFEDTHMKFQQTRGMSSFERFESSSSVGRDKDRVDYRPNEEYKSGRYSQDRRSDRYAFDERYGTSHYDTRPERASSSHERSYYEERRERLPSEYRSDYQERDYRPRSPSDRRRVEDVDRRRVHEDLRYDSTPRQVRDEAKRSKVDCYPNYIERDRRPDSGNAEAYARDQDLAYRRDSNSTKDIFSPRIESHGSNRSRDQYFMEHKPTLAEREQNLPTNRDPASRVTDSEYKLPSDWTSDRVEEEYRKLAEQYKRIKELKERALLKASSQSDLPALRDF